MRKSSSRSLLLKPSLLTGSPQSQSMRTVIGRGEANSKIQSVSESVSRKTAPHRWPSLHGCRFTCPLIALRLIQQAGSDEPAGSSGDGPQEKGDSLSATRPMNTAKSVRNHRKNVGKDNGRVKFNAGNYTRPTGPGTRGGAITRNCVATEPLWHCNERHHKTQAAGSLTNSFGFSPFQS